MTKHAWLVFALGSAVFAGLTAILGKVGVAEMNSNVATLIRTAVVLVFTGSIVSMRGEWASPSGGGSRAWLFLVLSGLATGASWLCYYRALQLAPASRVAPIDKLSVVVASPTGMFVGGTRRISRPPVHTCISAAAIAAKNTSTTDSVRS